MVLQDFDDWQLSEDPYFSHDELYPTYIEKHDYVRWTEEQRIYIADLCEKIGPRKAAREAGRIIGRHLNESSVRYIHKRIMKLRKKNDW